MAVACYARAMDHVGVMALEGRSVRYRAGDQLRAEIAAAIESP
jgi:hypothetical protein